MRGPAGAPERVASFFRCSWGWLWSLLPDRCQVPGCCRKGVRGNENRITLATITDEQGRNIKVQNFIICDYCHALFIRWSGEVIMTQSVGAVIEEPDAIVKVREVRPEPPPPPPPPPPRER